MLDGFSATPTGVFAPTDASNVMGSYPTGLAEGSGSRSQSSHIWAARDVNEAAGAKAPSNRYFYGRYGISTGKVTCQRCHDPHSRDATNTKILRLGTGSREQMCIDCHAPWNIDNTDHGLLSHPMVADYAAVQGAVANEGKYRAPADVATQGGEVVLVDGKVSCSSCHGVHFTDSDGTTLDGPGQTLSAGDGKLLKADGPAGNDKSMLCQACHTYKAHGSTNETVGCLVCHSGHAYNGGNPNYYVLRGQTETTTYGAVNSLAYTDLTADLGGTSTTAQLWAGSAGSADGYCERCHGDLTSMPGSSRTHVEGEDCLECHAHNGDGMTYTAGRRAPTPVEGQKGTLLSTRPNRKAVIIPRMPITNPKAPQPIRRTPVRQVTTGFPAAVAMMTTLAPHTTTATIRMFSPAALPMLYPERAASCARFTIRRAREPAPASTATATAESETPPAQNKLLILTLLQ
jgi:predicted CXXCH cytochrome family protein